MTTRRKFLTILGGGVVLAAGAGALWATTRDPAEARRPWRTAGSGETEPRRQALSFAILAPNPHNRQPWVADLSVADEVTLYCDADRRLPHTDPFDRQITIGLGCFLELFAQAAAELGLRTDVTLFPEGEPQPRLDGRPVARIVLAADASVERDPLFAHVLARRSNRSAYDTTRPVADAVLAELATAVRMARVGRTGRQAEVLALRQVAWEAMYLEMSTRHTAKETIDLLRIGRAEIEANPDGIALPGPFFEALSIAGLLDKDEMLDPSSTVFKQQVPVLKVHFDTAMAFLWLVTPGNSRADQINAGRDHVRVNLAATALGLNLQPMSQALQEFPEMRPHFDAMRTKLGLTEQETLQMLVRLGYGPQADPAPRWPYETRIRSA